MFSTLKCLFKFNIKNMHLNMMGTRVYYSIFIHLDIYTYYIYIYKVYINYYLHVGMHDLLYSNHMPRFQSLFSTIVELGQNSFLVL